jgi:hypothetical protein
MATCDYCGEKVNILYTCKHCKKKLCKDHKLPENHECPSLERHIELEIQQEETIPKHDFNEEKLETTPETIFEEQLNEIDYEPYPPLLPEPVETQEEVELIGVENAEFTIQERYKLPREHEAESVVSEYLKNLDKTQLQDEDLNEQNKGRKELNNQISKPFFAFPRIRLRSKAPIILVALLAIASIGVSGFLYVENDTLRDYQTEYEALSEITETLNTYYENLTVDYNELRIEYSTLNALYANLMQDKAKLEQEYNDIINYNKNINLVTEKTITIDPRSNVTEIYEIPFSGYITVNYIATGEIYTWIGSNQLEEAYFSRNPQFPDIASSHEFTVPVLPDVLLFIANPDESHAIEVTYTINFTY